VALGARATFYGAEAGDGAGSVATGDFNGDGAVDLAMGAVKADGPDGGPSDVGAVYVFFAPFQPGEARDAARGDQDAVFYGAAAGDEAGRALAAADLNGDGIDDLVVGAPFADGPGGRADAGAVYVVYGSPDLSGAAELAEGGADVTVSGAEAQDLAGLAVTVGDVSGDGVDDLIAGALWADGPDNSRDQAGEAYVIFGGGGLSSAIDLAAGPADATILGPEAGGRLGETVAAGDVTGDGVADLVVAANFASRAAGEVYVVPGGASLPDVVDTAEGGVIKVLGLNEGDQVGHSVAVGDADGDGFGDLLLGAVSADGPDDSRELAGDCFLVFGRLLQPGTIGAGAGGEAIRFYGADAEDRLGRTVALGDVNGDGLADALLVAAGGDGPAEARSQAGELYVFLAPQRLPEVVDIASASPDLSAVGDDGGDGLGSSVFGRPSLLVRDMDGDGLNDVVVTAPAADGPGNGRTGAGEAYIIYVEEK
jgi:hypothetical protein